MQSFFEKMLGKELKNSSAEKVEAEVTDETGYTELRPDRVKGRITKLSDAGWGFISSKQIPFTRIFFHWTALQQDTHHFTELRTGLNVEFNTVEHPEKGVRAIKIKVIE